MEFHLGRKLRLLTEPKYKTLYEWALQEIDDGGESVGSDQIPWNWSLYFTATEVVLSDEVSIRGDREYGELLPRELGHRRAIRTTLRTDRPVDHDNFLGKTTTYRMFGTDRIISDFQLEIVPLEAEDETESCRAGGFVSFTAEVDFTTTTSDDCVFFIMMVKPSTFDSCVQRIVSGTADKIILRVVNVEGFYSEWSPSISTSNVKVLTREREHKVEEADGASFKIPRLGNVGEVNLTISSRKRREAVQNKEEAEDLGFETTINNSVPVPAEPSSAEVISGLVKVLSSLVASTRGVIGLLIVLIIVVVLK